MKHNDTGDFCMIYVEPEDDKDRLCEFMSMQRKPVVLLLTGTSRLRALNRPEDFSDLRRVKRQYDLPVIFVIPESKHLQQLAARCGFPVYLSIDLLCEAIARGEIALSRQRTLTKTAVTDFPPRVASPRKTVPLEPLVEHLFDTETQPLPTPSTYGAGARLTVPLSPRETPDSPRPPLPERDLPAPPRVFATAQQPAAAKRGHALPIILLVLSLLIMGGASVGTYLFFLHAPASSASAQRSPGSSAQQIAGYVYFLSSGQLSDTSNQGIDDEVQINLHSLANPAPGKSYYAWLLSDANQGDTTVIYLGKLSINHGNVSFFYAGDAQHTNLLAITSRFLITEEDAAVTPMTPSPDYSAWRYYAAFPNTPSPMAMSMPMPMGNMQHYSYLDHLRHLLAAEPLLDQMGLPGGLNTWLYRNAGSILEWAMNARDSWEQSRDLATVRLETLRILTYLDGISFVQQDLPSSASNLETQFMTPASTRLAGIGLIDMHGASQNPPSYLYSIIMHLTGLIDSPGATPATREAAAQIVTAMNNVRYWLQLLHDDALKIITMTDVQLTQPAAFSILDDMVKQATYAYIGETDPSNGAMREGVVWIHDRLQALAALAVTPYIAGSSPPEMISSRTPLAIRMTLAGVHT